MLYLPWNLTVDIPVSTSLGNALSPFDITSTVLNASVLILAVGPAVIELVTALEKVYTLVSELIPTLAVIVVDVTAVIAIGA